MATTTFTLSPPTVPPTAAVGNGTPTTGLSGASDETPAGWPTAGDATAFEVEVTKDTAHDEDRQVAVYVSDDATLAEITGTWSGDDGVVVGGGGSPSGWGFDKFGSFRTEYIVYDGSPNQTWLPDDPAFDVGELDIRVRCRSNPWTGKSDALLAGRWAGAGTAAWMLLSDGDYLHFFIRSGTTDYDSKATNRCALSSLGVVDGEWKWLRVTYEVGVGASYYSSDDGESWTLAATDPMTGAGAINSTDRELDVGYGQASTRDTFDGDISDVEFRSLGGTLIASFNLDARDSQTDTSWPNEGTASTSWTASTINSPPPTGVTHSDTRRCRFEFDSPTAMNDWRLWVQCDDGSVTFDEIVLEYVSGRQRRFFGTLGR